MALYPGCGPRALISQDYRASSPVAVFLASDDERGFASGLQPGALDPARKPCAARSKVVDYGPGQVRTILTTLARNAKSIEANRTGA